MRLLQRYILLELLKVFAFLLSVLTVLLVFVGVFREVAESGLGPFQILQILPFIVPSLLPFTIPATLLLTVCVVYGRIAGDQEITAAKAAGINLMSLLWPSLFLGGVLSVCSLLLTDQVIPWSVGNIQRIVTSAMEDLFLDRLRTQNQLTDWHYGTAITVMGVDGKRLIRPNIRYAPRGREAVIVQAQEATFEFDLQRQEVILHLVKGHIDIPGERRADFDRFDKAFPLTNDRKRKPRHLSIREIRKKSRTVVEHQQDVQRQRDIDAALVLALGNFERFEQDDFDKYRREIHNDRNDFARLKTELHSRFALACSCFFFVLLGSPFSILQARRQFLTNFFLCFLPILLIYYPIVLLMMNLSKSGTIEPAWSMWVGNAILLAAGWLATRTALQH